MGMGPGMSWGLAERFGREGYTIGMISRTAAKLQGYADQLTELGIKSEFEACDVSDTSQLLAELRNLREKIGRIDILE